MSRLRILKQTRDFSGDLHNEGDIFEASGYVADVLVRDGTAERLEPEQPTEPEEFVPAVQPDETIDRGPKGKTDVGAAARH